MNGRVEPAAPQPRASGAGWRGESDRGSRALAALMIWLSLRLGRPVGRALLYPSALYFTLFARSAARASQQYLERVLQRRPRFAERFQHVLVFATTLLDRLYLAHGRGALLQISSEGEELMQDHVTRGSGAFLLGAHLGCFDVISALPTAREMKIVMAMYADHASSLEARLRSAATHAQLEIVPLGRLDAMLRLRDRLEQGAFVGMLADRTFADAPGQSVSFLGQPALFPTGPLRIAAALRRPVVFMAALYCGADRYHVVFRQIADFSRPHPQGRDGAVREAVNNFVATLESCCHSDPFNWFNFYDFWQVAPPAPDAVRSP